MITKKAGMTSKQNTTFLNTSMSLGGLYVEEKPKRFPFGHKEISFSTKDHRLTGILFRGDDSERSPIDGSYNDWYGVMYLNIDDKEYPIMVKHHEDVAYLCRDISTIGKTFNTVSENEDKLKEWGILTDSEYEDYKKSLEQPLYTSYKEEAKMEVSLAELDYHRYTHYTNQQAKQHTLVFQDDSEEWSIAITKDSKLSKWYVQYINQAFDLYAQFPNSSIVDTREFDSLDYLLEDVEEWVWARHT